MVCVHDFASGEVPESRKVGIMEFGLNRMKIIKLPMANNALKITLAVTRNERRCKIRKVMGLHKKTCSLC